MVDNPLWKLRACGRNLLDDHIKGGKHTAADVIAKAQALLSEPELLWGLAMLAAIRRTFHLAGGELI